MAYNIVLVRVNEWLPSNFCELQKNCIRNYKFKTGPMVNSTCLCIHLNIFFSVG